MRLQLSLFGPFQARLDGKPLKIRSRRSQAMLAMLSLAPRSAVGRDRLAATLWPDRPEEQARASLRQELSSLRRVFGADAAIVTADASRVCIDPDALANDFGTRSDGDLLEGLDLRSEPFEEWRRAEAARLAGNEPNRPSGSPADSTPHDIFEHPSVLVMAFAPASDEGADIAFATGLVIDLRTSLSLWRWYPVIGPEATGWMTDRDGDLREIARSVRAVYAISGAVLKAAGRIRVSVSLTEVASGHLIWTETFDGEMSDVFEMQEAVGRAVVARIAPEIGWAQARRIIRKRPTDMQAWQLVAQTDEIERTGGEGYGTPESNRAQVPLLERALQIEPSYARAWVRLGRYHLRTALQGWTDNREAAFATALECSQRGAAADPSEWEAQAYLALTLIFGRHDFGPGRFHALEAVRLNPSAPLARHACGCALEWLGEPEAALEHLHAVFRLNPNYPNRAAVLGDITTCEMFVGNIEAAVEAAEQLCVIAPHYSRGLQRAAVTLGHASRCDDAAEILARITALQPDFDEAYVRQTYPYAQPEHIEMILDGLRRAGWNG